ncbi:hypothetical protein AAFF_G00366100 [Aldrovandia affinis]|uniref:Uncharacterized protein n=1 Tax=Aldrovandia affinis TaxID=143900 RepID=A0AAD7SHC3_9TELE|nr:hypothetical protein AAFF_G00366100 [Aldrovandia affinis]
MDGSLGAPASGRGHRYILVVVDYAMWNPKAFAQCTTTSKTIDQELVQMFTRVGLPYVLFAIREAPQSTTRFSPFELLYAHQPRGLLDIAREAWEKQPSQQQSIMEHVVGMPIVQAHALCPASSAVDIQPPCTALLLPTQ